MDPETQRFFRGLFIGLVTGVLAWALLLYMVASIVDRV
jgi:hypothetical protein